jgi:phage FluMu protein Com
MPIELICQNCGQTLRVADAHAGKRARCPQCQAVNSVPAPNLTPQTQAPTPRPLFPETSAPQATFAPQGAFAPQAPVSFSTPDLWELKLEDGQIYGPVAREEVNRWYAEGRISPHSQLRSNVTNTWQWAGELFPALGVPLPSTTTVAPTQPVNLFGDAETTSGNNPYAAPRSTSYVNPNRSWQQPHRGAMVLVLGICGLLVCGLLAPIAVILGHQDLGEMRRGRMDPEGHGLTLAGVVLGWLVTAPMILGFLILLIAIVFAAVNG